MTSTHVDCWEFEWGTFATEVLAICHRQRADVDCRKIYVCIAVKNRAK